MRTEWWPGRCSDEKKDGTCLVTVTGGQTLEVCSTLELDPKNGVDLASQSHTELPVPAELTVKPSGIPGAGLGVFANVFIPVGVEMGPYEGKVVEGEGIGEIDSAAYAWEVRCKGESPYLIDASDPTRCNWMRFVKCAGNKNEQNVAAFQFEGQVFYLISKGVYPGSELLVWYGDQYEAELGVIEDDQFGHECLTCGEVFIVKSFLDSHINSCPANAHLWKELAKQQSSTLDLARGAKGTGQVITGKDVSPNECQYCGKFFNHSGHLRLHLRIHSGERPFKCEHCGKAFALKGNLQKHFLVHSHGKAFQCGQCGKGFTQKASLRTHLSLHSGDKPHRCEQCGKCFRLKGNLRLHERIHSGEKPYKCEVCGKCFCQSSGLRQHLRVHSGDRPHKCEQCGRRFSDKGNLQRHIRSHTGAKAHKCEQCGKCFRLKGHLRLHERIHSGEKLYECEECGKCFSQTAGLRQHLRVHSGDRPFVCEHCGRRFSEKGNLQRHVRTHARDREHQRELCGKHFDERDDEHTLECTQGSSPAVQRAAATLSS